MTQTINTIVSKKNTIGIQHWNNISFYTHPTMSATMDMLKEYDTSECYQVDFVIDIHAHTSLMGCFIYGNAYEDV